MDITGSTSVSIALAAFTFFVAFFMVIIVRKSLKNSSNYVRLESKEIESVPIERVVEQPQLIAIESKTSVTPAKPSQFIRMPMLESDLASSKDSVQKLEDTVMPVLQPIEFAIEELPSTPANEQPKEILLPQPESIKNVVQALEEHQPLPQEVTTKKLLFTLVPEQSEVLPSPKPQQPPLKKPKSKKKKTVQPQLPSREPTIKKLQPSAEEQSNVVSLPKSQQPISKGKPLSLKNFTQEEVPPPRPPANDSEWMYLSSFADNCFRKIDDNPMGAFYRLWGFKNGEAWFEFFGPDTASNTALHDRSAHLRPCDIVEDVGLLDAKVIIPITPGKVKQMNNVWEVVRQAVIKVGK